MVSAAQLSLFNTEAVIKPIYKIGDRVKVRKKPIAASYVKKGDIVEIAAIHPIDHSIKFWNERSERWEFIQADEISVVVTSAIDSPTLAEVAVGESIAPPANDDSPTLAEVAVGESIAPPANDDSPTLAEVAVGESIAPPSDTDYLLDPISTYKPRGTARGEGNHKYYRLSYRDRDKVRQAHIRGGNTDSPIAQAKVAEVRSLLAAGIPPKEVAVMIKTKTKNL